jgi:hypothetical protein
VITGFVCWDCGRISSLDETPVSALTEEGWVLCACGGKMHAVFPKAEGGQQIGLAAPPDDYVDHVFKTAGDAFRELGKALEVAYGLLEDYRRQDSINRAYELDRAIMGEADTPMPEAFCELIEALDLSGL